MVSLPQRRLHSDIHLGVDCRQVVYEWAKGTPFNEICGLTDVMEGSIVRAMVRLDETCRRALNPGSYDLRGITRLHGIDGSCHACLIQLHVDACVLHLPEWIS